MPRISADMTWACGVFEGEGSIVIFKSEARQRCYKRLQLAMTDEDVVRRFHAIVGCGSVREDCSPSRRKANKKRVWYWQTGKHEDVDRLLRLWYPLFSERRKARADVALALVVSAHKKLEIGDTCRNGHVLTSQTLYRRSDGQTLCKPCRAEKQRRLTSCL